MEKFKKRHKQLTSLVLSAAMIFSLVPVSYTHLTLPTIAIV